ncbi:MAG: tRNA (adenosine(37)-N6)-threonylcarbamoyltransferase complex dimerization subunit type 1 TsaB [Bacteroidales bacterium]|nr:tRNA (adenosine(37)-N6)-threonylcarbamoyltransferase complex dimerization subunit type 1 TsaB [Bacteroidales bacterium]
MARILLIETSTSVLSVALAQDGTVVSERVCTEPRMQASLTAPLVKEVLDEAGLAARDCDAVCVSSGPGSYTGLRVGVSTAKGLAFGAGIPLLAMGTLDILVAGCCSMICHSERSEESVSYIVPMIDARRMEVYTAVYSAEGQRLTEVESRIVGPDSFADYLEQGEVLFVGDGALKCKDVIGHPNARFQEAYPLARNMAKGAQKAFEEGKYENLAYFEPFYLKDFIATISKKNLW